jgi:hypothetical protein
MTIRPRVPCECTDPGCPAHLGAHTCREVTYPRNVLFRVDMQDQSGTVFCHECMADALDSGLYSSERWEE